MGGEHAPDTVWRAQELYCVDRLPFAEVAKKLGVADSTLRRWADRFGWRAEREAIARAQSEIRANTVKGRAFVLQKLLEAESGREASQVAFAVSSLERLALETQKAARAQDQGQKTEAAQLGGQVEKSAQTEAAQALENIPSGIGDEERAALLEQAVNRQLAYVLANPVDNLSARVRDIKAALDVLGTIRGKDKDSGLDINFEA